MKARKIISLVVLLLVIACSFGLVYTNAKYTSQVNGEVSMSVAKYVFNVTGSDSYNSQNTIKNIVLAETCDEATLVNGKIAPGTKGSFELVVDTRDAEVGIGYEIKFVNTTTEKLPTNLVLTLDGQDWTFDKGINGTIDANSDSKTVTHTIAWSWAYETVDGDEVDTTDGQNAFDYTFAVTATGTQVAPIEKIA